MNETEHQLEIRRWLRYAQEDLHGAEKMLHDENALPRHICWLAQQSAEKALKAALIFLQMDFPHRHDLDALRNLLPDDWEVKTAYPDLAQLTEWAVEARYPGDWPDAVESDARYAVKQAHGVWECIYTDLVRRGFSQQMLSH